jgi:hypothetical protein
MKGFSIISAATAFVIVGTVMAGTALIALSPSPVQAAPPTVTPSPGYDARLQEQRSAPTFSAPAGPIVRPVHRRHHVRHRRDY